MTLSSSRTVCPATWSRSSMATPRRPLDRATHSPLTAERGGTSELWGCRRDAAAAAGIRMVITDRISNSSCLKVPCCTKLPENRARSRPGARDRYAAEAAAPVATRTTRGLQRPRHHFDVRQEQRPAWSPKSRDRRFGQRCGSRAPRTVVLTVRSRGSSGRRAAWPVPRSPAMSRARRSARAVGSL